MLNLAEMINGDFSQSSTVAAEPSALCDIPGFFFLQEDRDDLFFDAGRRQFRESPGHGNVGVLNGRTTRVHPKKMLTSDQVCQIIFQEYPIRLSSLNTGAIQGQTPVPHNEDVAREPEDP
jgi:hypothetical protein